MIIKIISGGQTGVDLAALDSAIELNIPHGGYCPKGRLYENGRIPEKYNLVEAKTEEYSERTILNLTESDGALVFLPRDAVEILDGTRLTIEELKRKNKPKK